MTEKKYFYGNEISEYGVKNGYVDYACLAKSFDAVLNNSIMEKTYDIGYWDQESGTVDNSDEIEELEEQISDLELEIDEGSIEEEAYKKIEELENRIDELRNEEDYQHEIFQYYIVDDNGARILKEFNEIVFYNEELDMYVWGVTHYGTSWSYVLTDKKIDW